MTMTVKERQVRAALRRAGTRRRALKKAEEQLQKQTERALKSAIGVVPMEEAADLVDLSRSTVYQVYLPTQGDTDGPDGKRSTKSNAGAKAGGSQKGKPSTNRASKVQGANGRKAAKAPAKKRSGGGGKAARR